MIKHTIMLSGQTAALDRRAVVQGTVGTDEIRIVRGPEWDGLELDAVLSDGESTVTLDLVDDRAVFPWELAQSAGPVACAVSGRADGVVMRHAALRDGFRVRPADVLDGQEPTEYTEDKWRAAYEQAMAALAKVDAAAEKAEKAADEVVTGATVTVDETTGAPSVTASVANNTLSLAFSGLKGEQGPQGETGPQGERGPQGPAGKDGASEWSDVDGKPFESLGEGLAVTGGVLSAEGGGIVYIDAEYARDGTTLTSGSFSDVVEAVSSGREVVVRLSGFFGQVAPAFSAFPAYMKLATYYEGYAAVFTITFQTQNSTVGGATMLMMADGSCSVSILLPGEVETAWHTISGKPFEAIGDGLEAPYGVLTVDTNWLKTQIANYITSAS